MIQNCKMYHSCNVELVTKDSPLEYISCSTLFRSCWQVTCLDKWQAGQQHTSNVQLPGPTSRHALDWQENDIPVSAKKLPTAIILIFVCPCIAIQFQITTNKMQRSLIIYFYRRSTCFRRFLRPSSGAHNCTYSFRYCQPILLLAAIVDEMELRSISSTIAASSSIG